MPDGGHEEVEELQGELDTDPQTLGEHEQDDGQDTLAEHGRVLDGLLQQARQAGLGDAPQARTLKHIRKALRGVRAQVEAAEARGRARALAEFQAGNAEAVDAIRAQVRGEIQQETARERSLARLGIAPDSPIRNLFDGVSGDHRNFERHADLLRAAGVSWDADPLVRQVSQQRVAAWQQQAAAATNGNGPPVDLDPAGPVPEQVREDVIRQQVEAMTRAQAGGQPPGSDGGVEAELRRAQQDPGKLDQEGRFQLADRLNRELEGLSAHLSGRLPAGEGW